MMFSLPLLIVDFCSWQRLDFCKVYFLVDRSSFRDVVILYFNRNLYCLEKHIASFDVDLNFIRPLEFVTTICRFLSSRSNLLLYFYLLNCSLWCLSFIYLLSLCLILLHKIFGLMKFRCPISRRCFYKMFYSTFVKKISLVWHSKLPMPSFRIQMMRIAINSLYRRRFDANLWNLQKTETCEDPQLATISAKPSPGKHFWYRSNLSQHLVFVLAVF